jgi:RNase P/RNase MRP subunit POP5
MGTTTFSGPIKAGSVREGASANLGFVKMAQSAAWTQTAASAASTGIIIPANSQITQITLYITTAPGAANLSMGTTSASNELFTALAVGTAADVIKLGTSGTITDMDTWKDVGSSDVTLYVESSANTTGRGIITVEYIQNNNLA